MTILVIGGSGQLARSLDEAAKSAGVRLTTAGRPALNLQEPASIARAIKSARPSVVINAAAYTAVDKAEREADLAFAINAEAVGTIGRLCAERDIATLHVSTDYVFDGRKPAPYVEDDPVAPLGVYGRSKLAGEEHLRQENPRHVIVRTAWVYSPFGNNFLKTMLRLGGERPRVSVVNDQQGNPSYAPYLAAALLAIARHVEAHPADDVWGTYHAAGSGEATWFEFAHEIFAQSRARGQPSPELVPITTAEYPTPAARPANSRLDSKKLHDRFGIALPPWQNGITECLDRLLQPA